MEAKHSNLTAANIQVILLDEGDYTLAKERLQQQALDAYHSGKRWSRPVLRFEAFEKGWLWLENTARSIMYKLALKVEGNKLLVHCGCQNTGLPLCHHAYHALQEIIYMHGETYFKNLLPGGMFDTAFAHPGLFDKYVSSTAITVSPSAALGHVLGIHDTVSPQVLQQALGLLPVPPALPKQTVCYLVVWPVKTGGIPFVVPCMGRPAKNGADIKYFDKPLSGFAPCSGVSFTGNQTKLNELSLELFKIAERLPGIIDNKTNRTAPQAVEAFRCWQQVFQLLRCEQQVYGYRIRRLEQLKKIPYHKHLTRLKLSHQHPVLSFSLTDRKVFYQFKMKLMVNGRLLQDPLCKTCFVYEQGTLYLLDSFLDAVIATGLFNSGGTLTIFKEHYRQFEQYVLNFLEGHYRVTRSANAKQTAYA